ncbi:hypothetical protein ACFPRL_14565 [Pseudoclavibacter helvolus]
MSRGFESHALRHQTPDVRNTACDALRTFPRTSRLRPGPGRQGRSSEGHVGAPRQAARHDADELRRENGNDRPVRRACQRHVRGRARLDQPAGEGHDL